MGGEDLPFRVNNLQSCGPLEMRVLYHWRELPQVSFLSRQKYYTQVYNSLRGIYVYVIYVYIALVCLGC